MLSKSHVKNTCVPMFQRSTEGESYIDVKIILPGQNEIVFSGKALLTSQIFIHVSKYTLYWKCNKQIGIV